jgi:hypothetical protein
MEEAIFLKKLFCAILFQYEYKLTFPCRAGQAQNM